MKEWPGTLYRYNAQTGEREGMTFQGPEEVPEGQGWVKFEHLGPAPVVEKPKLDAPPAWPGEMPKLYRELREENARLKDTAKLLEDELAALKAKGVGAQAPETVQRDEGVGAPDAIAEPPKKAKRKA